MSEWFTSDTHFNHQSMVSREWRPQFKTVSHMNEYMIDQWNTVVAPGDDVWHLGDWALGDFAHGLSIVKRLNGHVHLIPGNHDRVHPGERNAHKWQKAYIDAGFESVQAFARRGILGQSVLLSHFPYEGDHREDERFSQWRLPDEGLWLIHGHVHHAWKVKGRMINVGVDQWDFWPVSLDEIVEIMQGGNDGGVPHEGRSEVDVRAT